MDRMSQIRPAANAARTAARSAALDRARAAQAEFVEESDDLERRAVIVREKRRAVFADLVRQGLTQQDIGDAVGLNRARVSRILTGGQ